MELIQGGFNQTCEAVIKSADFYNITPFVWNKQLEIFKVKNDKSCRICFLLFLYMCLYSFVSLTQIADSWEDSDVITKTYGLAFASFFIVVSVPTLIALRNAEEIADLFRIMVNFEWRHRRALKGEQLLAKTTSGRLIKGSSIVVSLGHFISYLMFLNIFLSPCFTAHPGYFLSPQCRNYKTRFLDPKTWTFQEVLARLIIAVGGTLFIIVGFSITLEFCSFAMIKGFCLRSYIKSYGTLLPKFKHILHHRSTIMIREIQIMLISFRQIYSDIALLYFASGIMISQTLVLFLATEMCREEFESRTSFLTGCSCLAALIFVVIAGLFGNLGWIYKASWATNRNIIRCNKSMKNLWFRKFFRSCPILKVTLGSCKYIEPFTALSMEEAVLKNAVNLLLLDK